MASGASFNKITHEKLYRYPYKVNVRQQLKENNFQQCSDFSYSFLPVLVFSFFFFCNIFIGYEPSFTIRRAVKSWNLQEYAPKRQDPEFICVRNDG